MTSQKHGITSLRNQAGTTLIEILITVVLVSIGLLGLAGLQLTTVQNSNSSTERFEATVLARDIVERMRANRGVALSGDYDISVGDAAVGGTVAAVDLIAWKTALEGLPNGDGAVEVEAPGIVTVMVVWNDISTDNTDAADDEEAGDGRDSTLYLRTEL